MGLDPVGKLVTEHASTTLPERKARKSELEQEIIRRMFTWMAWGMLILGIGIVMVVTNKAFAIGEVFKFVSTLLILGGVGVITGGVFRAITEGTRISGRRPVDQILSAEDTKSLPTREMPASLPSVTERTTQLIPTDDARVNKVIDSNRRE
jgi:hypothetical protein